MTRSHLLLTAGLPLALVVAWSCGGSPTEPSVQPSLTSSSTTLEPLTITSISPTIGSVDGGTISVRGTGFRTGVTATVGGTSVVPAVLSTTAMTIAAPAHAEGVVDILITRAAEETARLADAYTYSRLGLTGLSPSTGVIGKWVRLLGFGFDPAVAVTFGGQPAKVLLQDAMLYALAPANAAGVAEVVITNPDGTRASLSSGYTYQLVTIAANLAVVQAGATLSVSWVAPAGQSPDDWIGIFRVGAPNDQVLGFGYVNGAPTGMFTVTAPSEPGDYDFRYMVEGFYNDAARSAPVQVTP